MDTSTKAMLKLADEVGWTDSGVISDAIRALVAERDRLREAMEEIAKYDGRKQSLDYIVVSMQDTAREALAGAQP